MKTITIKDEVYRKLMAQKRKDESFSDLFERLSQKNLHRGVDAIKKLRGSIELDESVKDKILADVRTKRRERRT